MSLVVFLLVAVAASLLGAAVFRVVAAAYARHRERYVARTLDELAGMFLFIDPAQVLILNVASMSLCGALALIFVGIVPAAVATAAGFFLPPLGIRAYRRRRLRTFNSQLVDALQSLSSALRAGLSVPQALEQVAREAPAPLSQEFGLLVKELKLGLPLEDALNGLARRVGSDDLELVVVSTNVARQLGGNLAEMFETLSATMRERFRLEGRIDALTSQGRLQGWIVAALPLVLGAVFAHMRPDLVEPMIRHPFGWLLAIGVVLMEVTGILVIQKIVRIDV